jgi:hypothetical protein
MWYLRWDPETENDIRQKLSISEQTQILVIVNQYDSNYYNYNN